ncbi:MAG: hypothetical protein ABW215_01730 [Kibdelosporangium sp.]
MIRELPWNGTGAGRLVESVHVQGWRLITYLGPTEPHQSHYLMPARMFEYADAQPDLDLIVRMMVKQTAGLAGKIAAIDRLELSQFVFQDRFAAARSYLVVPSAARAAGFDDEIWRFARTALDELQQSLDLRITSQIDYDQKQLHPVLGGILESIDFAVRHDPSAVATVLAYQRILENSGIGMESAQFTVDGIGDLGYRIVRLLVEGGAKRVFVCDKVPSRVELAQTFPRVESYERGQLATLPCQAHIMSNNHTFDDAMAAVWASTAEVRVVGGPEAGIDRFHDARNVLHRVGIEFVPSVLCGSLGLICNLEESLGKLPDLEGMTRRYDALIQLLVHRAAESRAPFADTCHAFLTGGPAEPAAGPVAIGSSQRVPV